MWRMAPSRSALVGTCLAAGSLLVLVLASCAEPTQIVVQVYSDACEGPGRSKKINQTSIVVGHANDLDSRPPSAVRDGCEGTTAVGSLTIYPSGDKDEEVAIRVVSGIDATPDRCVAPGYAGCVAQTRIAHFIPNTTQRVVVKLGLACLNRTCLGGTTCDNGVCKDADDVLPDGGTRDNAPVVEAGITPEAGLDGAPADPCIGCLGVCQGGVCNVDCSKTPCNTGVEVCAPTLPCDVTCAEGGACADLRCTTSASCTIHCGTKKASCTKVSCNARTCDVRCEGPESCKTGGGGITLVASAKGTLTCDGENACDSASCSSPTCELSCDPIDGAKNACPPPASRPCTGGCDRWNTPIDLDP